MMQVANQFRRIWADKGRGDKDFSEPEGRLREAQKNLLSAASNLTKAAEVLTDLLKSKGLIH